MFLLSRSFSFELKFIRKVACNCEIAKCVGKRWHWQLLSSTWNKHLLTGSATISTTIIFFVTIHLLLDFFIEAPILNKYIAKACLAWLNPLIFLLNTELFSNYGETVCSYENLDLLMYVDRGEGVKKMSKTKRNTWTSCFNDNQRHRQHNTTKQK